MPASSDAIPRRLRSRRRMRLHPELRFGDRSDFINADRWVITACCASGWLWVGYWPLLDKSSRRGSMTAGNSEVTPGDGSTNSTRA